MDLFIPIEVKSGNKKAIPKIFYSFEEEYSNKTNFYVFTNSKSFSKEKIIDKDLFIIPNNLISKII
jgi:hypothetical protein